VLATRDGEKRERLAAPRSRGSTLPCSTGSLLEGPLASRSRRAPRPKRSLSIRKTRTSDCASRVGEFAARSCSTPPVSTRYVRLGSGETDARESTYFYRRSPRDSCSIRWRLRMAIGVGSQLSAKAQDVFADCRSDSDSHVTHAPRVVALAPLRPEGGLCTRRYSRSPDSIEASCAGSSSIRGKILEQFYFEYGMLRSPISATPSSASKNSRARRHHSEDERVWTDGEVEPLPGLRQLGYHVRRNWRSRLGASERRPTLVRAYGTCFLRSSVCSVAATPARGDEGCGLRAQRRSARFDVVVTCCRSPCDQPWRSRRASVRREQSALLPLLREVRAVGEHLKVPAQRLRSTSGRARRRPAGATVEPSRRRLHACCRNDYWGKAYAVALRDRGEELR